MTRIETIYLTMLSTNERVVFYIYPKIIHGDLLNLRVLEQFKLPLILNKIIKFWNSWNLFEFWAKKLYKLCKMASNQCIRSKAKRIMARLVLWTKQWTPLINKATSYLNCIVTLVQWPWNMLLPSHPMITNFLPNSSNLRPPKSSKHLIVKDECYCMR